MKDYDVAVFVGRFQRVAGVMVDLPGLKKRRRAEVTLCMRGLT